MANKQMGYKSERATTHDSTNVHTGALEATLASI